ncbi:MAG: hypothetical protein ABGY96_05865 [bacterium]|nr:hypothetical protein [Gammaproteobacteria bacterium]
MPRLTASTQMDTDGLQADVMRFMAIIAFCLISIMALVDNLEKLNPETATPEIVNKARNKPDNSQPAVPKKTVVQSVVEPVVTLIEPPEKTAEAKIPGYPTLLTPASAAPISEIISETISEPVSETPTPKSLALRFESDATFLGLIARNDISIYASTQSGFVGLTPEFNTRLMQPTGALYELLPESIPAKVRRVFGTLGDVVFLVSLPDATQRSIEGFANDTNASIAGGSLIVHADGAVSHET